MVVTNMKWDKVKSWVGCPVFRYHRLENLTWCPVFRAVAKCRHIVAHFASQVPPVNLIFKSEGRRTCCHKLSRLPGPHCTCPHYPVLLLITLWPVSPVHPCDLLFLPPATVWHQKSNLVSLCCPTQTSSSVSLFCPTVFTQKQAKRLIDRVPVSDTLLQACTGEKHWGEKLGRNTGEKSWHRDETRDWLGQLSSPQLKDPLLIGVLQLLDFETGWMELNWWVLGKLGLVQFSQEAQLSAPKKWTVGPQGLICLEPADVLPFLLSLLALFGGVPNIGVKMAPKSQWQLVALLTSVFETFLGVEFEGGCNIW